MFQIFIFLRNYLSFIIGIFLLNACAMSPEDCDPNRGGFITGLSAMASGCYEERVAIRENELAASRSVNHQLQGENRQLREEKRLSSAQVHQAQSRLAALQRQNAQINRDINRIKAGTTAQQNEKARLQREMKNINRQIADLKRQLANGRITELELQQETQRLEIQLAEAEEAFLRL